MICLLAGFLWNSDAQTLTYMTRLLHGFDAMAKKGDVNKAQTQLRQFIASPPTIYLLKSDQHHLLDLARLKLAQVYLRQGQEAAATKTLDEIRSTGLSNIAEKLREEIAARPKLLEADRLVSQGRWYDAEQLYIKHLGLNKTSLQHRLNFHRILIRQGRAEEARRLYADGIFSLDQPEDGIASLWVMDVEEPVIGDWEASVQNAADFAPDDPRVMLAQAFLARSAGRFGEANLKLNALLKSNPDDQPNISEHLELAKAEGNVLKAEKTAARWKCDRVQGLRLAAWFLEKAENQAEETRILKSLLEFNPSDRAALSRLAELSARVNKPSDAAEFQRLKREAEDRRVNYTKLCRESSPFQPAKGEKLAETAAKLGLAFDSWAWRQMAESKPLDPAMKPSLEIKPFSEWNASPNIARNSIQDEQKQPELKSANEIRFEDIAEKSGLGKFTHYNGAPASKLIPPLSSAGGVGLIDFDNDGLTDVYAVQSGSFPPDLEKARCADKLFRNRGNNRFEDVSEKAGISQFPGGYGHGVAVADIDNDGFSDLFITRWRRYALYRNRGDGTFEDITEKYGMTGERDWPTSAAFADLDNDGDLDLYVTHYMEWIEGKSYPCIDPNKPNTYDCRPRDFPAMKDHLFRNDGGKFTDISEISGIAAADTEGRGLGVVSADFNNDGRMDLFVANDTTANFLFLNKGEMKFEESADVAGVAANGQGGYQAGMGTAAADINGDGLIDLAVTNFYNESTSIFLNLGGGLFADRTAAFGVAAPSRFLLGFGITLEDFNNDGRADFMTANGHVADSRPAIPWRMPLQVMQGVSTDAVKAPNSKQANQFMSNRLLDVSATAGPAFHKLLMARGLAAGDLDNDGLVDAVVQSQNDPLLHLKNQAGKENNWLSIRLHGTKTNRDGVGCEVSVTSTNGTKKAWCVGGGSFQSAADGRLHFGLGKGVKECQVEIKWPSGTVDRLDQVKTDRSMTIEEGKSESPGK